MLILAGEESRYFNVLHASFPSKINRFHFAPCETVPLCLCMMF